MIDTVFKLNRGAQTEFLLENYVDEDLQDFLLPLDIAQNGVLHSKYNIRNNFITPNGVLSNVLSSISLIVYFAVYFITVYRAYQNGSNSAYYYAVKISLTAHFGLVLLLTIALYISNWMNGENNVEIIILIQQIKNILRFSRQHIRPLVLSNWITIIVLTIILIFELSCTYYGVGLFGGTYIALSHYGLSFYDFTLLYVILMAKLMRSLMELWIEELKMCIEKSTNDDTSEHLWSWNVLFKAYCDLTESFCILKKTSGIVIVSYTVMSFYLGLLIEQIVINFRNVKTTDEETDLAIEVTQAAVIYWMSKNILFIIYLSIQFDQLYCTETEIQCKCMKTLKVNFSVKQKQILKNVLRVSRIHFTKMTPWSMFVVGAPLPIAFTNVLTTYAIVLLQFQL